MNRVGVFASGVVVGVVTMQIGLALFLRSGDFGIAALFTAGFGVPVTAIAHAAAKEWV